MEIKDRVAIDDNIFVMRVLEEIGVFKKIVLERTPTEVLEEGTPINKELLQPLVDAVEVQDISSDFLEVIQEEGFVNEIGVYAVKQGSVVSASVVLSNTSGTGFLEKFRAIINSTYRPMIPVIVSTSSVKRGAEKLSCGDVVVIVGDDGEIMFEWITDPSNLVVVQFSFTYICKGAEQNGDS